MVGASRNFLDYLVLRPIACVANSCRPSKRRSSQGAQFADTYPHRTKVQATIQSIDTHERSNVETYQLEIKADLSQKSQRNVCDQAQCSFLSKLPAEVRVMVYHYVLCVPVPVVHVVKRKDGSLCHVRCRASRGECGTYRCYNDYSELSRSTKGTQSFADERRGPSGGLLLLPLTCNKVSVVNFSMASSKLI